MPRIVGINIPEKKHIEVALTYIYGIGRSLSRDILKLTNIPFNKNAGSLTAEEVSRLKEVIEKKHKTEGDLRRQIMLNVKRLKDIGAWRGIRHVKKLPVRGQQTKTNTRTVRGNVRKTVGSGRKTAAQVT